MNNKQYTQMDYWAALCESLHPADYTAEMQYLIDLAELNKKYKKLKIHNEIPESIIKRLGDNLQVLIYNDTDLSREYPDYIKDYVPGEDDYYDMDDI